MVRVNAKPRSWSLPADTCPARPPTHFADHAVSETVRLQVRTNAPPRTRCRDDVVLWAEQGERYDGDSVTATVGLWSGVQDNDIDAVVAELSAEPVEVRDVRIIDRC